jgi:AcrR family transcriptional regulator
MTAHPKLPAAQRRDAIIYAVRRVFAARGFHGTTTRALAEAAGVSEALLFKHFPTKEALYTAMQESCCNEQALGTFERLTALPPSAATLVEMVRFLVSLMIDGSSRADDQRVLNRLMLRSLAEDGEFARLLLRCLADEWVPQIVRCLRAAAADGDATPLAVRGDLAAWFVHHLAAMIVFAGAPDRPVVEYGVSRKALIEQVVHFTLRGMGLKERVIRQHARRRANIRERGRV